jgi:exportin-2 (importin alpha re-exporter)
MYGIILSDSDEELFIDDAEEYIRRDIEGSDVDTRRRAACDLVRSLSRYFEENITEIFGAYIVVCILHLIQLVVITISYTKRYI